MYSDVENKISWFFVQKVKVTRTEIISANFTKATFFMIYAAIFLLIFT